MPTPISRLPRLRWRGAAPEPFVAAEERPWSDEVAQDLQLLERELMPAFARLDEAASRAQNSFRLERLTLILGGAAATSLGAVQASVGGGIAALALTQAVLAGALSVVAFRARARRSQQDYLTSRLKAERLRGEYFLFLVRRGPYADEDGRVGALAARVEEIETVEAAP